MPESLIRETDALGRLTGDALLLLDNDGIILHATEAAGALFGSPPGPMTGLPFGIPLCGPSGAEITLPATGRHVAMRVESLR